MDWEVEFYQKENGEIPVEDFLLSLNPKLRAKAFSDIKLLQTLGIHIQEPFSSAVKGERYQGLFELRVKFSSDITRIFYFLHNKNTFILLHGFLKKANNTPK
ncbi:MAG TPA: type II toxin-antitoxin system RelE/ParE family toxin [Candidatus Acidoferrum sp.]|nr:type II toxin-antitoxin system RelE/ParE family toxin [Candidatus Acidoferrum sp.]